MAPLRTPQFSKTELAVLQRTRLFAGLSSPDFCDMLEMCHPLSAAYKKGEYLHRAGEPLLRFGVVLSGHVQVASDDIDGNRTILTEVGAGVSFGESHCFLATSAPHISIIAMTDCRIAWLALPSLHWAEYAKTHGLLLIKWYTRFTSTLSQRTLEMNDRIRILSRPTVREKILSFLLVFADKNDALSFEIPFNREEMATYLAVNRTVLSRELSLLQKEGKISFKKNRFTLSVTEK